MMMAKMVQWFVVLCICAFVTNNSLCQAESGRTILVVKTSDTSVPFRSELGWVHIKIGSAFLENRAGKIQLPDETFLYLRIRRRDRKAYHGQAAVWDVTDESGKLVSSFVLGQSISRSKAKKISARFSYNQIGYEIKSRGTGFIMKANSLKDLPGCGAALPVKKTSKTFYIRSASELPVARQDGNPIIDIAFFYTPQAAAAITTTTTLDAHAIGEIARVNANLQRSGVSAELRLVYTGVTSTNESGTLQTDLVRLATPSDGYFEDVYNTRETYLADLATVITSHSDASSCGIAYRPDPRTFAASYYAFSVVGLDCLSVESLSHEIAHNFGAEHDYAHSTPSDPPIFPYFYGYQFTGQDAAPYRTIMAYQPGTRIPYYSNPRLTYQGVVIGNAGSADVSRGLSEVAPYVAAYKSVPTPTPTPIPTATATPYNPATVPAFLKGSKSVFDRRTGACTVSGQIISEANTKLQGEKIWLIINKVVTKKYGAAKRTDKKGTFSITTKFPKKSKIYVYFPEEDLYFTKILRCQ